MSRARSQEVIKTLSIKNQSRESLDAHGRARSLNDLNIQVLKQGFLYKQSEKHGHWQKRYFRIYLECFGYSQNENQQSFRWWIHPGDVISIQKMVEESDTDDHSQSAADNSEFNPSWLSNIFNKHQHSPAHFMFKVKTNDRVLLLGAETAAECDEWVSTIERCKTTSWYKKMEQVVTSNSKLKMTKSSSGFGISGSLAKSDSMDDISGKNSQIKSKNSNSNLSFTAGGLINTPDKTSQLKSKNSNSNLSFTAGGLINTPDKTSQLKSKNSNSNLSFTQGGLIKTPEPLEITLQISKPNSEVKATDSSTLIDQINKNLKNDLSIDAAKKEAERLKSTINTTDIVNLRNFPALNENNNRNNQSLMGLENLLAKFDDHAEKNAFKNAHDMDSLIRSRHVIIQACDFLCSIIKKMKKLVEDNPNLFILKSDATEISTVKHQLLKNIKKMTTVSKSFYETVNEHADFVPGPEDRLALRVGLKFFAEELRSFIHTSRWIISPEDPQSVPTGLKAQYIRNLEELTFKVDTLRCLS